MDGLISILLVDDNAGFCSILRDYLNQRSDLNVKGIARDGIEAIEMIKDQEPEIVVLDLIMPNLDGIGVLERVSMMRLKRKPIFIVLSAIGKDIFIQKALKLGAEYYILKPFDAGMLVSRIRQLYGEKYSVKETNKKMHMNSTAAATYPESYSSEQVVTDIIKKMRIQPNIAGYRYLREAVIYSLGISSARKITTKNIYRSIAEKHKTTAKIVSRAIRCAIDSASKKVPTVETNPQGTLSDFNKRKPSNKQTIISLADKARLAITNSIKVQ